MTEQLKSGRQRKIRYRPPEVLARVQMPRPAATRCTEPTMIPTTTTSAHRRVVAGSRRGEASKEESPTSPIDEQCTSCAYPDRKIAS